MPVGNFKTTGKIPTDLGTGVSNFVIMDEFNNTISTEIKINESLNRFLGTQSNFGVTSFNKEIKSPI